MRLLAPSLFAVFALLVLPQAGAAIAGENCKCRFNGGEVNEGETVCIKTASGQKLARCERVLNNTSWKMLQDGCPVGSLEIPAGEIHIKTAKAQSTANDLLSYAK